MNQRAKCCLFGREQRDLTFPGTWEADKKPSVITNYAIAHITTPKHATPRGHQLCTALLRRPHTFSHGRGRVAPRLTGCRETQGALVFSRRGVVAKQKRPGEGGSALWPACASRQRVWEKNPNGGKRQHEHRRRLSWGIVLTGVVVIVCVVVTTERVLWETGIGSFLLESHYPK